MDKQKGRGRFIAMCVLPAVLLFFVFMILPTFNIFRMSLYKWGGFSSRRTFVGFEMCIRDRTITVRWTAGGCP